MEDALTYIPAEEYDTWLRVGMALHASGEAWGRAARDTWSQRSDKYDAAGAAGEVEQALHLTVG